MKTISSILLCIAVAFALASAKPWYSHSAQHQSVGYFDSLGFYHHAKETAKKISVATTQQSSNLCQSTTYGSGRFATYLHICDVGSSYCYITNGPCCTEASNNPISEHKLDLSDHSTVNVQYHSTEGAVGACFTLDRDDITVCSQLSCRAPACVPPIIRCFNNTPTESEESCSADGCECKEGFAPPDCCECDLDGDSGQPHFRDPETGECRPFCAPQPEGSRCLSPTIDGCLLCRPGYKGDDCCQCDDGYYMHEDGTCRRPECMDNVVQCTNGECACETGYLPQDCCDCAPGLYKDSNGTCKEPECTENVVQCTNGACTCETGYLPQDCCECAPGFYEDSDGTCKEPECTENVVQCTNGECTCETGYLPQDCCECAPGFYKDSDGTCKEPECMENVVQCINGTCTCETGYLPQDCCECAPGFYKDSDGTCKEPECTDNVVRCINGECTCEAGYLPQDCCECAPGFYEDSDGTCKEPVCTDNVVRCVNGECTCETGYLPQDCCECAPGFYEDSDGTCKEPECKENVDECTGGTCTCKSGYKPHDCCQCADDYFFNPETQACEEPCTQNIESCTNGECNCANGFSGIDCCTGCVPEQDIIFVIDTSGSNSQESFCGSLYGMDLLIKAIQPGNSFSGTRVQAVLFPKVDTTTEPRIPFPLFNLGTQCEEAMGAMLNLADAHANAEDNRDAKPESPYMDHVSGRQTYPAPAIRLVRESIEGQGSQYYDRRRLVVLITDGRISQNGEQDTYDEVDKLRNIPNNRITVIALGNTQNIGADDYEVFRDQLVRISGSEENTILSDNAVELSRGLVRRAAEVGAICSEQEEDILNKLQDTDQIDNHCFCLGARGPFPPRTSSIPCNRECGQQGTERRNKCLVPEDIWCSETQEYNKYYVGSPNYGQQPNFKKTSQQNARSQLEQEILEAVEEVLQERMHAN